MTNTKSVSCPDCGVECPSKWSLENEHRPKCPLNSGSELRQQEAFEWQLGRINKSVVESYSYAARAFSAYINGETERARLFHSWILHEVELVTSELASLTDAANTKRIQHPRMQRMRSAVGTLIEQAQDLLKIVATLNREYGVTK